MKTVRRFKKRQERLSEIAKIGKLFESSESDTRQSVATLAQQVMRDLIRLNQRLIGMAIEVETIKKFLLADAEDMISSEDAARYTKIRMSLVKETIKYPDALCTTCGYAGSRTKFSEGKCPHCKESTVYSPEATHDAREELRASDPATAAADAGSVPARKDSDQSSSLPG